MYQRQIYLIGVFFLLIGEWLQFFFYNSLDFFHNFLLLVHPSVERQEQNLYRKKLDLNPGDLSITVFSFFSAIRMIYFIVFSSWFYIFVGQILLRNFSIVFGFLSSEFGELVHCFRIAGTPLDESLDFCRECCLYKNIGNIYSLVATESLCDSV